MTEEKPWENPHQNGQPLGLNQRTYKISPLHLPSNILSSALSWPEPQMPKDFKINSILNNGS